MNRTTSTDNIQEERETCWLRDTSTVGHMIRCEHLMSYEMGTSGKDQLALR